jgi:hypothetical protein
MFWPRIDGEDLNLDEEDVMTNIGKVGGAVIGAVEESVTDADIDAVYAARRLNAYDAVERAVGGSVYDAIKSSADGTVVDDVRSGVRVDVYTRTKKLAEAREKYGKPFILDRPMKKPVSKKSCLPASRFPHQKKTSNV